MKSDGEDSPIYLLPKSRASDNDKILRKQKSLMHFSKCNKKKLNEDHSEKTFK